MFSWMGSNNLFLLCSKLIKRTNRRLLDFEIWFTEWLFWTRYESCWDNF